MSLVTPRRFAISALAVGIVFFAAAPALADSYRNDTHHFSLEPPDGWETMPIVTGAAIVGLVVWVVAVIRKSRQRMPRVM
jgi:hypothetical protein